MPRSAKLRDQCPQGHVQRLGETGQKPVALAGQRIRPPISFAAALPLARNRCDHFTTLATLTLKNATTVRQLALAKTRVTTRRENRTGLLADRMVALSVNVQLGVNA